MNKKYTRFEKARIIGARSLQISMGAPLVIDDLKNDDIDSLTISIKEYENNMIPITTKRFKSE